MDEAQPTTLRPLADIQAEIAAALRRLADLEAERRRTRAVLGAAIVADFDAGLGRAAIAARWRLDYGRVGAILHKAGRTERARRAAGLDPAQRADYERLIGHRVPSRLARAIALGERS